MIANYHTHTDRCRHAVGADEEYVKKAIERGLQILGFSDHTPQYFPGDYYSTMRMFPEELSGYCDTVRKLKADYAGQLQIHLGVEAEYYPLTFQEMLLRLQDAGVEYMILGQHWIGNEFDAPYSGTATEEQDLKQYCDQVIAAMETGKFTYFAHPDIIGFIGDGKVYEQHIRRLCRASIDTRTPLEINFLGLAAGRRYPNEAFWQIAAEEGCQVVFGIDAHEPEAMVDLRPEELAKGIAQRCGITVLPTVPFKQL